MDAFIDFLIDAGPAGMFVAAFLAGSILPFSSELVLVGLLGAGADPTGLLVWGTVGNVLGGWLNFFIGRMGRISWITRFTGITAERLESGLRPVRRYGAWMGLLSFVPVVGDLLTVAMGYLRTPRWLSLPAIALGKYARYQFIVSTWVAAVGTT